MLRRACALALTGMIAALVTLTAIPAGHASDADVVPGQLLVRYQPGTSGAQIAAAESEAGATPAATIDALGVRVLRVPEDRAERALEALSRNPHVEFAERDAIAHATAITPNDTYWSKQWGTVKMATPTAWDTTTGSSSVVVAVVDTGVETSHPDLQGAFLAGYDFVNRDSNPADDQGHGTMVSGVIAARGNNATGVAGQCWKCSILPVKVLDAGGSGSYSNVASGITYAADRGARVINLSLGGASASSTLASAVSYAANKGALLVAAAGNAGTSAMNYPAAYEPTIAVAASDSRDARYSWSSYGSWVEVAAPGCDYTTKLGATYGEPCGTSFASPMTAGVAGLMLSANPSATASTLRSALLSTADPVGTWVARGRVNAAKAVAAVAGTAPVPAPAPSPTTSTVTFSGNLSNKQQSRSYSVTTSGGAFEAALSFKRASMLTLTVRNASGTVVAQGSGPSVLRVAGSLPGGTFTFEVSGATRATFELRVVYAG